MPQSIDLEFDVTADAGLDEPAAVAITVTVPDIEDVGERPVVCFAKPGGGYSKGYFTEDLPGPARGAQADWHARRGWIFVAVDHLGVGNSSLHDNPMRLDYTTVAAASQSAEAQLLARLADGTLVDGLRAIVDPLKIGIGQSMGGCMTIVQQGRYHCYDGVGVLGYSAVHTHPPTRPGRPPTVSPWIAKDTLQADRPAILNAPRLAAAMASTGDTTVPTPDEPPMGWAFFYDDVDSSLVSDDLTDFPTRNGEVPPWASATLPLGVASSCLTPGIVASEAAAITSPVLVAMGERDVGADNAGEPRAYSSANSVDLFVCPRMGHMHNFAGTRELFWQRIDTWATWVAALRSRG
jgi:alpha-beta hydrolase superfamily lysophospholipase